MGNPADLVARRNASGRRRDLSGRAGSRRRQQQRHLHPPGAAALLLLHSWSGDGRYIAALGPGPEGTTLDILTAEGELATEQQLDTRSFYLAWEPGGDDLVIHRDETLELVRDPLDLETLEPLGEPGQSFLAPGWIPGTRQIVIVDEADGGRLVRVDVDTGQRDDLGPVGGNAGLVVSPDGSRLLLSHSGPNVELGDDIDIALPAQDEQDDSEGDGEGDEETAQQSSSSSRAGFGFRSMINCRCGESGHAPVTRSCCSSRG